MKLSESSFILAMPLMLVSSAFAQHQTFSVMPASSSVGFTLGASLHTVHGTFRVQSGTVDFNTAIQTMSGSVVVAAGSGTSGNDSRDRRMTTDILDAAHFAEVSFTPRSYQGTLAPSGDSTVQVTGTFTLHGAAHELTVPLQIHIEGPNCTAKARFNIPYIKWGLKDPSTFILRVAKEVEIDLNLVGRLSQAN